MNLLMLIATVVTSAAVIWQAVATARSARSAAAAADAANKALALAEAESRISRGLLQEAVRTRIDSGMPSLTIVAFGDPKVSADTEINRLPKDFSMEVTVTFACVLRNNSSRPIQVTQTGPYRVEPGLFKSDSVVHHLAPVSELTIAIAVSQPAGHWAAVTEKLAFEPSYRPESVGMNGPFYEQPISFLVAGDLDTTARDEFKFYLHGSPLQSVFQQEGAWTSSQQDLDTLDRINSPIKEAPLRVVSLPATRTYFASISRGEELA